jgi:hypothetical protein
VSDTEILQIQRRISALENETRQLRLRLESMLSRSGGGVSGQIHLDGWIQFEEQEDDLDTPSENNVRLYVVREGGLLQVVAAFPSGNTVGVVQDT